MPYTPYYANRTDGNGKVRTYEVHDGISCSPNEVEAWATKADGSITPEWKVAGPITVGSTTLLTSSVTLADSPGGQQSTPTLSSGPVSGEPTKWITIMDNGTPRYIPTWS